MTPPPPQRLTHALLTLMACLALYACGGGGGQEQAQVIDPPALPLATAGAPYRAALSTSGGQGPYQWEVASGSLPTGLTLDAATGVIQGKATQPGQFQAEVTVQDANQHTSTATVRMDVVEPDAPLPANADRDATQAAGTTSPISRLAIGARSLGATANGTATALAATPSAATLPGLLTVLNAMPEGTWMQASLNSFADVWTPEELRPWDTNSGGPPPPSKIIGAWSGFAWDSNRGDLILYGGGHANYPGNDIYRWHASTRLWERASLPSDITKDVNGNFMTLDGPDAAPVSAHTYDNNIFLPTIDRFLTFGGAAYNNGADYRRTDANGQSRGTGPYLWDPNKADPNKVGGTTGSHVKRVNPHPEIVGANMWQNRDFRLNIASNPYLPAWNVEGCTGYALENGKDVVYVGARLGYGTAMQLFKYVINDVNNPRLDSWTLLGGYWSAPQGQTVCTYDPGQKIFVRVGNSTTPFTFWDVTAPGGYSNYEQNISYSEPTGEFAAKLGSGQIDVRYCGLDFDPIRKQYALWCGGADVWMLIPPSARSTTGWTLKKQAAPVAGSIPTSATGAGILGKWKYIPNLDAFMALQDSTLGNIWIYKPAGWSPPGGSSGVNQAPTVSLTAPITGTQVPQGSSISLVASATDADGSVASVNFYEGSTLVGAGVAPLSGNLWTFSWNTAAAGNHTLQAVATDNLGAQTISAAATIQVVQASGITVVLQDGLNGYSGTRDAYVASNALYFNLGTDTAMTDIYVYSGMMVRFAIFNRDGGPIPDNALITAASLELYKSTAYSQTLSAYRMLCDWQETQVTWGVCRTGVPWGALGVTGAGTDYVAVADGAGLVAWDPGWVKIDVTPGLSAMQAGAPNNGWRLRRTAGDDINTKRYLTHEYAQLTSLRPKLTVSYTLP